MSTLNALQGSPWGSQALAGQTNLTAESWQGCTVTGPSMRAKDRPPWHGGKCHCPVYNHREGLAVPVTVPDPSECTASLYRIETLFDHIAAAIGHAADGLATGSRSTRRLGRDRSSPRPCTFCKFVSLTIRMKNVARSRPGRPGFKRHGTGAYSSAGKRVAVANISVLALGSLQR